MSGKKEKEKRRLAIAEPTIGNAPTILARFIIELNNAIARLSDRISDSHKNKKIPSDYSLGFINGLIFCQHKIIGEKSAAKFFDRTGSIGKLPVPVALRTQEEITKELGSPEVKQMEAEVRFLEQNIITQAKGLAVTMEAMEKDDKPDTEEYRIQHEKLTKAFSLGVRSVKKAVKELEAAVEEKLEVYREEKKKMESTEKLQQEATPSEPEVQRDEATDDTGPDGVETHVDGPIGA